MTLEGKNGSLVIHNDANDKLETKQVLVFRPF